MMHVTVNIPLSIFIAKFYVFSRNEAIKYLQGILVWIIFYYSSAINSER